MTLPGGHELGWSGAGFAVYFVQGPNGRRAAKEYLASLGRADQAKFHTRLQKLADGHRLKHRVEIDGFGDGLFEIIIFGHRLTLCYQPGRRAFLAHGFGKRSNRPTPRGEIETGRRLMAHVVSTVPVPK